MIVDDEKTFRLVCTRPRWAAEGFEVRAAANERGGAAQVHAEDDPDLVILDRNLPDCDGLTLLAHFVTEVPAGKVAPLVLMATAYADVEHAVQALKLGAHDYLTKPLQLPELTHKVKMALEAPEARASAVERHARRPALGAGPRRSRKVPHGHSASPAMKRVAELVEAVAQSPATTVLIEGESGTGKQIVARLIHDRTVALQRATDRGAGSLGAERAPPFVELNAAALPEQFVESELFGHDRGAFTDAKGQKPGLLELADGGSLFLDEVAELSPSAQTKLLKVLETGSFRRLGGVEDVQVQLRFIAATHPASCPSWSRRGLFERTSSTGWTSFASSCPRCARRPERHPHPWRATSASVGSPSAWASESRGSARRRRSSCAAIAIPATSASCAT